MEETSFFFDADSNDNFFFPIDGSFFFDHQLGDDGFVFLPDNDDKRSLKRSLDAVSPTDTFCAPCKQARKVVHARWDRPGGRYTFPTAICNDTADILTSRSFAARAMLVRYAKSIKGNDWPHLKDFVDTCAEQIVGCVPECEQLSLKANDRTQKHIRKLWRNTEGWFFQRGRAPTHFLTATAAEDWINNEVERRRHVAHLLEKFVVPGEIE